MMAALGSTQQQMTSSSSFEKEVEKEEDFHLAADPVPPYMNGHLKESNTKSIRTSPTRAVQSNQHNNDNRGIINTRSRVSSSSLSGFLRGDSYFLLLLSALYAPGKLIFRL